MTTIYSDWTKIAKQDIKLRMKLVISSTQNSNNNTSYATVKQYIESANYIEYIPGSPSGYSSNHKLVFEGSTYNVSTEYGYTGNTRLIQTKSKTITHNANGEASIKVSGNCSVDIVDDDGEGHSTTISISSKTVSLPKIDRSSTVTSNATSTTEFGDTITISINSKSQNYTHTLNYSMYNASGSINLTNPNDTSVNWLIPLSLIQETPDNANPIIKITCETFNGTKSLGTKTYSFNCLVPDSYIPTISSFLISEADELMQELDLGIYVQNKSKLHGVITASGSSNSTIKSYLTSVNDVTYTSNEFITNALKYNGEKTITANVTDSRGRTATTSQQIEIVEYFKPTIIFCKIERCKSNGVLDEEGTYGKATVKYKIAPVNNLNTTKLKVTYGTSVKEISLNNYEGEYTFSELFYDLENNASYNFKFEVIDLFDSYEQSFILPPSFITMSLKAGGKGVTFGQAATEEGLISHMNSKFYKDNWFNNVSVDGLKTEKYAEGSWITYAED